MSINDDLGSLAASLYGLNYAVYLHCFPVEHRHDESEMQIVRSLFPHAVLGGIGQTDRTTILQEMLQGVTYRGDYAHGPEKNVLESDGFVMLLEKCRNQIHAMLNDSESCWDFSILEGHPAYPVYWDFAYLIRKRSNSYILIGSSSD